MENRMDIELDLGGVISFGSAGVDRKFIHFEIGVDEPWGYSHRLWLTSEDLEKIIELANSTKQEM
jgi:hypothetical protein